MVGSRAGCLQLLRGGENKGCCIRQEEAEMPLGKGDCLCRQLWFGLVEPRTLSQWDCSRAWNEESLSCHGLLISMSSAHVSGGPFA